MTSTEKCTSFVKLMEMNQFGNPLSRETLEIEDWLCAGENSTFNISSVHSNGGTLMYKSGVQHILIGVVNGFRLKCGESWSGEEESGSAEEESGSGEEESYENYEIQNSKDSSIFSQKSPVKEYGIFNRISGARAFIEEKMMLYKFNSPKYCDIGPNADP